VFFKKALSLLVVKVSDFGGSKLTYFWVEQLAKANTQATNKKLHFFILVYIRVYEYQFHSTISLFVIIDLGNMIWDYT